jgi:hypothetical protein
MRVNHSVVDLDSEASPAVLAGILGISPSSVVQGKQTNMLPPTAGATYRQSIQHYIGHWKEKSSRRSGSIGEAALLQKMKLDAAKTESEWQSIKQKKQELLDIQQLAETFEPVFLHIRTQLVSLARKFPQIQPEIDRSLEELYMLGEKTLLRGKEDLDSFIEMKLAEEPELAAEDSLEEIEDLPLNTFV